MERDSVFGKICFNSHRMERLPTLKGLRVNLAGVEWGADLFDLNTDSPIRIARYYYGDLGTLYEDKEMYLDDAPDFDEYGLSLKGILRHNNFAIEAVELPGPLNAREEIFERNRKERGNIWDCGKNSTDNWINLFFKYGSGYNAVDIGAGNFIIYEEIARQIKNPFWQPAKTEFPVAVINKGNWQDALIKCIEMGVRRLDEMLDYYQLSEENRKKAVSGAIAENGSRISEDYRPVLDAYLDHMAKKRIFRF